MNLNKRYQGVKMNELKTLKDLKIFYLKIPNSNYEDFIKRDDLKAEAVKWVKEIRNVLREGLAVENSDKILLDFFNLTEEDLKNEWN